MRCPRCNMQLSPEILDRDYYENHDWFYCDSCHKKLSKKQVRKVIDAEDCIMVREQSIEAEDFMNDPDSYCMECSEDCALAQFDPVEDIGLIQDAEGNWCYPEDL